MHKRQGFTLIELLVVIAIIGILATLVITQLGTARAKARISSAKSDIIEMGKSVESYRNDDQAADYVINNLTAKADTLDYAGAAITGTTALSTIFTTTASYSGTTSTYGTLFPKTPGKGIFYSYFTGTAAATRGLSTSKHYVVSTNGLTSDGSTGADIFYVNDGSNNTCTSPVATTCPPSPVTP